MEEFIVAIMPQLLELIAAVATAILAWLAAEARRRWGVEIEARHREALHSALTTGAQHARAKGITDRASLVRTTLHYAQRSVPDAIAALAPSPEQLRNMAEAKLAAPR